MAASAPRVIPWSEAFELRYKQDSGTPLHVQVVDVGPGVLHVRQGDELFLHEITTDDISLRRCRSSLSTPGRTNDGRRLSGSVDCLTEADDDVDILLPRQYGGGFMLCPRYPLSHCFRSVREVIDALPAVCRLFYPVEGFDIGQTHVKAMERLEIVQQISDPLTGMDMLCVRSMKTETQMLLPATLRTPFVQLSSNCFKCGPDGITAFECMMGWKPGQPPFQVKLCPSRKQEEKSTLKIPKQPRLKRDKRDKKKKHASWADFENLKVSDLQSEPDDHWLIPGAWREETLFMKPFQKIRVQNVMFNAKDFTLPEAAKLKVKVLSNEFPPIMESIRGEAERRDHMPSSPGNFSGPLRHLPIHLIGTSRSPLLLLITEGDMTTCLRQQMSISQGTRLAVRRAEHSDKILMECEQGQKFIVSLSYTGTFQRAQSDSEFSIEAFLTMTLPCQVRVTKKDDGLGYDQLHRRRTLRAIQTIKETTLFVEIVGADGQVLSEQPFEIPLCRTRLSVKVLEMKSTSIMGCVPIERLRPLPAVEFITESQLEILKRPFEREPEVFQVEPSEFPLSSPPSGSSQKPEALYSSPSKPKLKSREETSDHPPPRPPKSPNFTQQNFSLPQTRFGPPERPPKPDRYKDVMMGYPYNSNQNNGTENNLLLTAEQTSRLAAQGAEQDFMDRNRTLPLQHKHKGAQNSFPITEDQNPMNFAPALPPKPQAFFSDFRNMHCRFDPSKFTVDEQLVTIEEEPTVPQNPHGDVGIYGEGNHRSQQVGFNAALRRARKKASRQKRRRGTSMVNPNYGERLGEGIKDAAFTKTTGNSDKISDDDDNYEFASDVAAYSDEDEEYETPVSPVRLEKRLSRNDDQYKTKALSDTADRMDGRFIEDDDFDPTYDDIAHTS